MTSSKAALWSRFQKFYTEYPSLGLAMDISRVDFPDSFLATMERPMQRAYIAMAELEKAREECPTEPVEPPQPDRDALAWEFAPAPDSDWPQQPGVTRQAYEFEATNPAGETWTSTATYLQRGRMILALYTTPPDSPATTLKNAPDQARFVEVMTNRLTGLPEEPLQYGEPLDDPNDISV